jgi:hypothetical protein
MFRFRKSSLPEKKRFVTFVAERLLSDGQRGCAAHFFTKKNAPSRDDAMFFQKQKTPYVANSLEAGFSKKTAHPTPACHRSLLLQTATYTYHHFFNLSHPMHLFFSFFSSKKCLLIALLTALFALGLRAQPTLPATLTLRDGQVLQGKVEYQEWTISPRYITFFPAGSGASQRFDLAQVSTVELQKSGNRADMYRSFLLPYDTSITRKGWIDIKPEPNWKTDWLLMHQLYAGTYTLYKVTDREDHVHYFIQQRDSLPTELVYKKYTTPQYDSFLYNRRYRKQLVGAFLDCPRAREVALQARFNTRDLLSAFKKYDECKGVKGVSAPSDRFKFAWIVAGGGAWNSPNRDPYKLDQSQSAFTSTWVAATGLEVFFPRSNRRRSWYSELMYQPVNLFSDGKLDRVNYQYEVTGHTWRWNNLLRFGSPSHARQRLFAGIGISLSKNQNINIKRTRDGEVFQNGVLVPIDEVDNFRQAYQVEMGFLANVGFQKGRFGAELRYDYLYGQLVIQQTTIFPLRNQSAHVLLTYRLTRYRAR